MGGLFYTVGGTSGFNYFMDVNVLDLRSSPPAWQSSIGCQGLMMSQRPGTDMNSAFTTASCMYWVGEPASQQTGLRSSQRLTSQRSGGRTQGQSRTPWRQSTTATMAIQRRGDVTALYRSETMHLWSAERW